MRLGVIMIMFFNSCWSMIVHLFNCLYLINAFLVCITRIVSIFCSLTLTVYSGPGCTWHHCGHGDWTEACIVDYKPVPPLWYLFTMSYTLVISFTFMWVSVEFTLVTLCIPLFACQAPLTKPLAMFTILIGQLSRNQFETETYWDTLRLIYNDLIIVHLHQLLYVFLNVIDINSHLFCNLSEHIVHNTLVCTVYFMYILRKNCIVFH